MPSSRTEGSLRARRRRAGRARALSAAALGLLAASLVCAQPEQAEGLPPRSEWRASASSPVQPGLEPARAIDGELATRWAGSFSPGQWLQIDLGRPAEIGGAVIHWDAAFASAYLILSSQDGEHWENAYATTDSPGGTEYVFFKPVRARYLRLASAPQTTDWGISVREFEPLPASDSPRITGLAKDADPDSLWSGTTRNTLVARGGSAGSRELHLLLPRPLAVSGLEVFWESARRDARLEGRDASGHWQLLSRDPGSFGAESYLADSEARVLTELRLTVRRQHRENPAIRRLRLLSPTQVMTSLKRYEIVAGRARRALFPTSLHGQQVYWTAVGVPGGDEKSLFDEYGDLEAFNGGPLVQPLWREHSGRTVAAYGAPLTHSLRQDWMPMPAVQWSPQAGLTLQSEALAADEATGPVTLVRYRLENSGTHPITGRFALVIRPVQVNPPWQHGGISPIRSVGIRGSSAGPTVLVNGRALLTSLTAVTRAGVAPFGPYGQTEITRTLVEGRVPAATEVRDDTGLGAAALVYDLRLEPGAHRDVVLVLPLAATPAPAAAGTAQAAPPGAPAEPAADFDAIGARTATEWQAHLGHVVIALPDRSLVATLLAQVAYMLVNQRGPVLLAGPRNYDRSFIRDGSATAEILLRMGLADRARAYLRWYAEHALHRNGLISPILNYDGSVNRGLGSDDEYDSQGEFIALVAAVARLDGGADSVREYLPSVRGALQFLQQLRERTLAPDELSASAEPQRYRGILPPSISHEGYPRPTRSYWDDYWALKGWHDGIWLMRQWGQEDLAAWASGEYAALRGSLAASIRSTMAWKRIDYVPASADLGDSDPTSVSIALDPCGQQDLLPAAALATTFTRYLAEVRSRAAPGAVYAYTPYEFRNVLTFVRLDRPRDAVELLEQLRSGRHPAAWQVFAEVVRSQLRAPFYLGDMPHTWVGAEYVRAVIGMLLHEDDQRLELLPGVPPEWVAGAGLALERLPTAFGVLSLSARGDEESLRVRLEPGLRPDTPLRLSWPNRRRPVAVTVDGQAQRNYGADGIELPRPFRELIARWD
jgi:hypothetical protein